MSIVRCWSNQADDGNMLLLFAEDISSSHVLKIFSEATNQISHIKGFQEMEACATYLC